LPSAVRCSGDVGQPQDGGCRGGERPLDLVVVHRRPGTPALAAAGLAERAPPAIAAQIAHAVRLAIGCPACGGLVDQEAVAVLRVVAVGVEQRVGPVGRDSSLGVIGAASHR
jgi:hypothetical protein